MTLCDDISGKGIKMHLDTPLKKKDRLKILLHFPGTSTPITTFSKVVWCKKKSVKGKKSSFDIGLEHIKINPKDKERLVFRFCEMMLDYFISGKPV